MVDIPSAGPKRHPACLAIDAMNSLKETLEEAMSRAMKNKKKPT